MQTKPTFEPDKIKNDKIKETTVKLFQNAMELVSIGHHLLLCEQEHNQPGVLPSFCSLFVCLTAQFCVYRGVMCCFIIGFDRRVCVCER